MVMLGYLNPVQNAVAFTPDGWLRTGDFCDVTDQGWLTVAERPRGLIGPEGAAASRLILETAIRDIAGVDEAVVDALDDGETLRVVVQARADQEISDVQIVRALSERALWTGPVLVEARETLPRTASGKLDRGRALS
jgi:acyl-CoA synthetase (AMP-forming)/AMP-acid ligase II